MATLDKFGVPLAGDKLGILHPKQSYRFRVVLSNFGNGQNLREITQNTVSVTRPTFTQEVVDLHAYNSIGYIAGKPAWEPITLTVRDDINSATSSAVGAQIQKQFNHFEQTSAVAGVNYKFNMEIHALDGTNGDELESWVLEGCFLTNTEYAESSYESSDALTITLSVRYDNATQISGPNNNGGSTVGGDPFPNQASPTGGATFG
jgi:hypothetical protein